MKRWLLLAAAVVGCGGEAEKKKAAPGADAGQGAASSPADAEAVAVLPAVKPLPEVPVGLPPIDVKWTPEQVALGELLFFDKRIGKGGKGACDGCHQPAMGFGDDQGSTTLAGKANLRKAPALVNLAWATSLGWDGRFADLDDAVEAHWKGQLDIEPDDAIDAVEADPVMRAQLARGGDPVAALAAFVATRYQGDAPWDRYERDRTTADLEEAEAGYVLFTGKAGCATCHVPPLYTDHDFHAIVAGADEGRGRIDPAMKHAFRTPTLRGATLHPPYLHDGSAATLEAAIAAHPAQGALTEAEQAQLVAFVKALSP